MTASNDTANGVIDIQIETMPELFENLASNAPEDTPMFRRRESGWTAITYADLKNKVRACGLAARVKGFSNGDVGCVLAGSSPEWMIADFGLQGAGLTVAGIYPTEPASKVTYILNDCRASLIFVDERIQRDKILEVWPECPNLQTLICFSDDIAIEIEDPRVISFTDWLALGAAAHADDAALWGRCIASVKPSDIAILIYTSGTTGPPKGAMLTHSNIVFQAQNNAPYYGLRPGWKRLAFLPLCHVAERVFTYCAMYMGSHSYFIDDPNALAAEIVEIQPNFFLGVPRIFEKFQSASLLWRDAQSERRRAEFDAAITLGLKLTEQRLAGLPVSDDEALAHDAAIKGVLGDMRRALGLGDIKGLSSGGARFNPEVLKWYLAIGIPFMEVYGMTECGLVSINRPDDICIGSVGAPCEFGEVKLSKEGEILLSGPHIFAGYLGKPDKTAEALQGGWFHTGDVGQFDDQGRLFIVDRIKDLIITSGGKNITPTEIELKIKRHPIIAEAVAIGDGRKFVSALIFIDRAVASTMTSAASDFAALCASNDVVQAVKEAVRLANEDLSQVEKVKVYQIVPHELMPGGDEVTPTMKIKRRVVAEKWADLIEIMYA